MQGLVELAVARSVEPNLHRLAAQQDSYGDQTPRPGFGGLTTGVLAFASDSLSDAP